MFSAVSTVRGVRQTLALGRGRALFSSATTLRAEKEATGAGAGKEREAKGADKDTKDKDEIEFQPRKARHDPDQSLPWNSFQDNPNIKIDFLPANTNFFAEFASRKAVSFAHLSRPAVESQVKKLKANLKPWNEPPSDHVLNFETREYFTVGPYANPAQRKVVLKVRVSDLKLSRQAEDNLIGLVEHRFDAATNTIKLVGDRYPSQAMNKEYLKQLLHSLLAEAHNPNL